MGKKLKWSLDGDNIKVNIPAICKLTMVYHRLRLLKFNIDFIIIATGDISIY
jgi:hypothetical protein